SRPTRELVVTIGSLAPFSLIPAVKKLESEAGKKIELVVKCERQWPEFKGPVTLIPLSFPGPIKMQPVTIAEGKTEAKGSLERQAGTRPGDYTLAFTGQGQVPFAKDPKAAARPNSLVPLPSRPITLTVLSVKK